MIPLGPFLLQKPIGRGGMAEVWAGVHREQKTPVAIKVLTNEKTRDSLFISSFRNEVRAVAGLTHPNIVTVFDYGQLPDETEERSNKHLRAGSPYLVMERADGGSLRSLCGKLNWAEVRHILLSLLDALAHAHARGVIHRDLKPKNVLFSQTSKTWMITDFGLAHAVEQEELSPWEEDTVMGTPAYMAPEQFECRWRDYGPWTDLYALGCLAYSLCEGAPPFSSSQPVPKLMFAHTRLPVPRMKLELDVPDGFEDWVQRLLEKEPSQRFRRAADAAWALLCLESPEQRQLEPVNAPPHALLPSSELLFERKSAFDSMSYEATDSMLGMDGDFDLDPSQTIPNLEEIQAMANLNSQTLPGLGEFLTMTSEDDETVPGFKVESVQLVDNTKTSGTYTSSNELVQPGTFPLPPFPHTWRRAGLRRPSHQMLGVGLGLYGLRSIPLVGREKERDLLWSKLHAVRAENTCHAVILRGPAGCGKSRLAEWLCERGHEVGTARVLKALHSPDQGSSDGLEPMLIRYLRSNGLKRKKLLERIKKTLQEQGVEDQDEPHALTELLMPATETERRQGARAIQFGSPTERYALLQRFLQRISLRRPVILWLDDVHWGLECLRFAQYLLQLSERNSLPVLLIMTVREEALAERTSETERLQQLMELPKISCLDVGPLARNDRSALVRELLGLEAELAGLVEERTKGNPLFAVQLVGDWVQRGILELGERGFRLKEGAQAQLPDDLHEVWAGRIERLLEARPEGEGYALELAAILGLEVDNTEWERACKLADLEVPLGLLDELLAQRLASTDKRNQRSGWSFVHGMLRESLERRARETSRWKRYHDVCAKMLQEEPGPWADERLGRHLLAAQRHKEALRPLLDGALKRFDAGDYPIAKTLLRQRRQAMEHQALPANDPLWGEGWILTSRIAIGQGDLDEADKWAARAEKAARKYGWEHIRAQALRERGRVNRERGEVSRAWKRLQEAEVLAQKIDDTELLAHCRQYMGYVLVDRGALKRAKDCFLRARQDFEEIDDDAGAGKCCLGLGNVAVRAGQYEEANEYVKEGRALFDRCGSRSGVANSLNVLGEIARLRGDLAEAEKSYRDALKTYRAIGTELEAIPKVNLGLVLIDRERYEEALQVLQQGLEVFEQQGRRSIKAAVHAFLLPCTAHAKSWHEFDQHLSKAMLLLKKTAFTDVDVARMTYMAGDIACDAQEYQRALQAYELSLHQWQHLDRTEEYEQVQQTIKQLDQFLS